MARMKKPLRDLERDRRVAKSMLSNTWWTVITPLLVLTSAMCTWIGNSGGLREFLKNHWIFATIGAIVLAGLLLFAFIEVRRGIRKRSEFIS